MESKRLGVVKSIVMSSLGRMSRMGLVGESASAESMSASSVDMGWCLWTSWIGVCDIMSQLHRLDFVVMTVVVVVCWVIWSLASRRRWPVIWSVIGIQTHPQYPAFMTVDFRRSKVCYSRLALCASLSCIAFLFFGSWTCCQLSSFGSVRRTIFGDF